jgi:hypothetical protein
MSANSFFLSPKGMKYETSLNSFVSDHELTTENFINGNTRSKHAIGGDVSTVATMPSWAEGQNANTPVEKSEGGQVHMEWTGGADNYRIRKKNGGEVSAGKDVTNQIMDIYGSIFK